MTVLERAFPPDLPGEWSEPAGSGPGAILSEDRRRRLLLWRIWTADAPRMLFVMLNPSTASGRANDRTTNRCMNFAARETCGGFEIVNLFSQRSTSPAGMRLEHEPEEADRIIELAVQRCAQLVVGWGALENLGRRLRELAHDRVIHVVSLIQRASVTPLCLGVCSNGMPRHPLYLPAVEPLVPWAAMEAGYLAQILAKEHA